MLKSWGYGFSFDEDCPEMQVYGNACVDNCELHQERSWSIYEEAAIAGEMPSRKLLMQQMHQK